MYKFINDELNFLPKNELTINTFISASHFENGEEEFSSNKERIFDDKVINEINSENNLNFNVDRDEKGIIFYFKIYLFLIY